MKLISWVWFWYVLVGFLMGGGAVIIWNILKKVKLKLVWYEWILMILSTVVFLLMSQTFIASFYEFEPKAAWFSLIFMGIPILLMAVVLFRSLKKRYIKNSEIN
ncbi:dehalogenase [Lutibacter citreus]|uniref:dehalogenase n=1 Tax=Lutibacter citreus TaxID=2138210 RepID=UPI000DBE1BE6|nr:dehalogenase [Lutibacter citreus]